MLTTVLTINDGPKADRWIGTIAVWQIFGGALSLAAFLDSLRLPSNAPGLRGFVVTGGIIVALFAIVSGLRLRHRRTEAIYQSLIIQALQLVGFSSGSTVLQLTLGPYVYLTMLWGQRFSFEFGVRPSLQFHLNGAGTFPAGVALNLLALFCFARLLFWELPTAPDLPAAPSVLNSPSDPDVPAA